MAYNKTTWTDRVVSQPHQYKDQSNNTLILTRDSGVITSVGTEVTAGRMNNIETGIVNIDGLPVRSTVQSAYGAVLSMPASTKNGLVRGTLSGMTLNNTSKLVVDTSYTPGGVGNLIKLNTSGVPVIASSYSGSLQVVSIKSGDKWFLYAKTDIATLYGEMGIQYSDGSLQLSTVQSPINARSEVYGIITANKSLNANIATSDNSNGQLNPTKMQNFVSVNMTSLGLDALTADQMKDLCDNGYFEGLKGSDVECVSVGKNLFDGKHNVGYVYAGDDLFAFAGWTVSNKIKIKPSTNYTLSGLPTEDGYIYQFDKSGKYLGDGLRLYKTDINGSFATASTCGQIAFGYSGVTLGAYPQLELGSTATAYEPFKQSTLSLDKVLNRVPNGVADNYALDSGIFTQNVQEYTLVAGDVTSLSTALVNIDVLNIKKNTDYKGYGNDVAMTGEALFPGFKSGPITNSLASVGLIESNNTTTYKLAIPKGTYANLAAAQTALAGTKILYQLATPVTTVYNKDLLSFESGTLYDNGLIPTYKQVTTPINVAGSLEDQSVININYEARLNIVDNNNGIKFYGKYSQMSGSSLITATGTTVNAYIPFSVEDNDDFGAINLGTSTTKLTIPTGVASVVLNGIFESVLSGNSVASECKIDVYKNGVFEQTLFYRKQTAIQTTNLKTSVKSKPISVATGNYLELYATLITTGAGSVQILAGGSLNMEVLK